MPCFGTSKRTRGNAEIISEALGTDFRTVDIKSAVNQHFEDICHDPRNMNVVYENSQARERTQILMDMANAESALVIGTGDLSELALGFATYNGDHMSMFGVNGSIPKTLMRAMVRHFAGVFGEEGKSEISLALYDIVNTPVSPELLPTDEGGDIAQCTEGIVGPYELHDYFIYYTVKYGLSPVELLKLATASFSGVYDGKTIKGWLRVFIKRFFSQQFKRSCMPDGVKVTDISLSPRGSFAMPSDISSAPWIRELEEV
jgi:NAD+ synthase (glutamine-hydrolysing)